MTLSERPDLEARCAPYSSTLAPLLRRCIDQWQPYRAGRWLYEDGCFWKGALDLSAATGLRFAADFAYREISARIDADGMIAGYTPDEYNIDHVNPGRAVHLLWQATGEQRFRRAVERQLDQLASHPRTASGNYWHKHIYPNQVWLDGLYMAQPLRCAWAAEHGERDTINDVLRQFRVVWQRMREADTDLLRHGWDESGAERWADPTTGLSANVWSRALGWYVMALIDCIESMHTIDSTGAEELGAMLKATASALLSARSGNGLWYQLTALPDVEGNFEETSASLMIAYALMKAARLDVLDAAAGDAGEQALRAIATQYVEPTALRNICGVAGLGNVPYRDGSVAYYLSEPVVSNDPKGLATLLMASAEALRR